MEILLLFIGLAALAVGSLLFLRFLKKRDQFAASLRESQERYRLLAETSPDMIYITDRDGKVLYVNENSARALRRMPEELIGTSQRDLFPPEIASRHVASIQRVFTTGEPFSIEREIQYPAKKMWTEIRLVPLRDQSGTVTGVLGISRDITDRKLLDNALRESEERYKTVTTMTSDYIFMVTIDDEGKVVLSYVSENFSNITGRTIGEMLTPDRWQTIIHPEDMDCFMQFFKEHVSSDQPGEIECRSFLKSGKERWIQILVKPKVNEITRRPYMLVGAVKDITERKNAENALKASLNEKEVLLKEIHHRVKNNLQIISSLLSLQIEKIKDEKLLKEFYGYRSRVNTMAIIHEKLYQSDNYSSIDFADYITTLVEELTSSFTLARIPVSHEMRLDKINLTINQAIPCGLIINEIITNSIKYAFPPDWEGDAQIMITMRQDPDNTITLQIRDNGIGFQDGSNVYNSDTLGVSLIDLLTKQINGTIQFDGSKGASYTITFVKQ